METFGAFLLLVAAFSGTVMEVMNPLHKLTMFVHGKRQSEINKAAEEWANQKTDQELLTKGCGIAAFLILALFFTYIVEPVAVLYAITNDIGHQPLAYAMGGIVILAWIQIVLGFRNSKKSTNNEITTTAVTEDGSEIEAIVVGEFDDVVRLNRSKVFAQRAFFALPTFYLWYLFLVVIDVL